MGSRYLYQVLIGTVAVLALLKDWKEYGKLSKKFGNLVPLVLSVVMMVVTLLSVEETYNARRNARIGEQAAEERDTQNQTRIGDLTDQVRQEREENQKNSDGFRKSFSALYDKYSELAARVKNEDLLKEIKRTREELVATQGKLDRPKATLTGSFWDPDQSRLPIREITVPKRLDGSVSLDLVVFNNSDTAALKGGIIVRVCSGCRFSREPEGFQHLVGSDEQVRELDFEHIFEHTSDMKRTIEVIPPLTVSRFGIHILYRCETCISGGKEILWVNVQ